MQGERGQLIDIFKQTSVGHYMTGGRHMFTDRVSMLYVYVCGEGEEMV